MNTKETIEIAGNASAILTALVATLAGVGYKYAAWKKTKCLEDYLRSEKQKNITSREDKGQRSILHLMARVGLTESEILQASFKSRYIKRLLTTSAATHLANDILLEYDPLGKSN